MTRDREDNGRRMINGERAEGKDKVKGQSKK